MNPLELFVILLRASLLSIGGQSALPVLRDDLVASGLLTDRQVVESLAIGRLAPGPTGLYIISLGYFVLGWAGAALALLASVLPPLSLVAAAAFLRRRMVSRWAAGAVRGLALVTSGMVLSTTSTLAAPMVDGGGSVWQFALLGLGAFAVAHGRRHPAWVIGSSALVGLARAR